MPEFNYLGAMPPKVDIRDYTYAPAGVVEYPEEFELPTPPVKNQGQVNSCVAHVSAEIEEYFNIQEGHDYEPLSVGYIYGCREGYTGMGMYLRDALKTLKNRGIATQAEFNYNKEVPEMIRLFQEKEQNGGFITDSPNTITSYFSIGAKNINNIKSSLMNNGPVMGSIFWYNNYQVKDGVLNGPRTGDGGNHCVLIYGWNKQGWLIQNSWGKNWGNGGKFVYPYEYGLAEAWGVTDTDNKEGIQIPKSSTSKFFDILYKIVNFCIRLIKK